jgi:galactokinase/mevalonate kinase-like predicted kinase
MRAWLNDRGLSAADLWDDPAACDLFTARLYAPGMVVKQLEGYWDPRKATAEWISSFKDANRLSIREINARDDAVSRDERRMAIRKRAVREAMARGSGWKSLSINDFTATFDRRDDREGLRDHLRRTDDELLRLYRRELLAALGDDALGEAEGISFEIDYVAGDSSDRGLSRGVKLDQIVWARSPVRLDLGGGWSDTPPYTLRFGGQVTNVAVDLNGQPPIQVFCRPATEPHIRIHSIDLGVTETITDFARLVDYRTPTSPFALPKAAFCLLGLTPSEQHTDELATCLKRIGCGVEVTLLCAVPKGSGLGTSSILGATILAALQRFFGRSPDQEALFRQVLQMEQMLTTCGGWQDQIGGVVGGVKYIECRAGMKPAPVIHQLDPHLFADRDSHRRFTLFYTGVTRLAKNILQEVVDRFNRNTPAYLFTVDQVRQLALDARSAIARRDTAALAAVIRGSWRANKLIHPGTTNEEVERILSGVDGTYTGMKLLGAGGGGYALFVSRDEEQADALRQILRDRFEDQKARIVDFALNAEGLQVSVS